MLLRSAQLPTGVRSILRITRNSRAIAERDGFLDVGEEFQLVLDIFGGNIEPSLQLADILGAVDDAQMPVRSIKPASPVAPSLPGLGFAVAASFL